MNHAKKSLMYFIAHTTIGIIALLVVLFSNLPDDYKEGIVFGIAGGFIFTGILGVVTSIRLMKNPKKAKEIEIAKTEERTQLIRMKTNSTIYSIMLYIQCIGTLTAGVLGFKQISITMAVLLLVQLVLYMVFGTYYGKKY